MSLRLYNTLTRSIQQFEPLQPGRVSLYTCGPTVYNYAHIGNFRTFLFEDLLHRWLEASGYDVLHIMNLTDVDDKTIGGAVAAGQPLRTYVQPYIDAFHEDRHYLRIKDASVYPRATDYVGAMIQLVEGLLAKDLAYRGADGSVYFAISRFPDYGKLSQLDRRELKTGAGGRVSADEYSKEDVRDFALWKAAQPQDEAVGAAWDAPFGRGRPGWHLECSAMALELIRQHLGTQVLDIHAGGVDLIFPHHEDEIAQSCGYTGQEMFARFWVHGEFLNIAGTKMSKRYGNILTARDLREQGVDAGAVRLLVFSTHYRQKLDWTDEALKAAQEGSTRLGQFRLEVYEARDRGLDGDSEETLAIADRFRARFRSALDDDLNAPQALAALFDFVRETNRSIGRGGRLSTAISDAWSFAELVLDVATPLHRVSSTSTIGSESLKDIARTIPVSVDAIKVGQTPPLDPEEADWWARSWAELRKEAKKRRDFSEADRIRDLLRSHGYEIRDSKDGTFDVVRGAVRRT